MYLAGNICKPVSWMGCYVSFYISDYQTCGNKSALIDFHVAMLEGMSEILKHKLEGTTRTPGEFYL